jgi:hypothetical protein
MCAKSRKGSIQRLSSLVFSGAIGGQLAERLKELMIWQDWEQIVGRGIAGRARPLRFTGGVLTITVVSSAWMQELNFMKESLIEKLNSALGEQRVREIVFKAGALPPVSAKKDDEKISLKPVTPEQQAMIDNQVAGIEDQELRNELRELMKRHYQRV